MFDKDGPNQICIVMRHLDKEMGPFMEVSDFKYGLATILGNTTCLKRYISFYTNQDEDSVRLLLPRFNVNSVNHLDVLKFVIFSVIIVTEPNGKSGSLSQVIITLKSLWSVTTMK